MDATPYMQSLEQRAAMARRAVNALRVEACEIYADLARQDDPDWHSGLMQLQQAINRRTGKVAWHLRVANS